VRLEGILQFRWHTSVLSCINGVTKKEIQHNGDNNNDDDDDDDDITVFEGMRV
jgi:hypothetical protein